MWQKCFLGYMYVRTLARKRGYAATLQVASTHCSHIDPVFLDLCVRDADRSSDTRSHL